MGSPNIAIRERQKNFFVRSLAIVATIVTIVALYFFIQARHETETARGAEVRAEERRVEAERLLKVSVAQALAAQGPHQQDQRKQDERGALLVRQAYVLNERSQGHALAQIDDALRTVLTSGYFSHILRGHEKGVAGVTFAPDGRTLGLGQRRRHHSPLDLYSPGATPLVLRGHEKGVEAVAFSPNGQILASGVKTAPYGCGICVSTMLKPPSSAATKFRPLSGLQPRRPDFGLGSWDNTVRLWNLRRPEASPLVLRGHEAFVHAVAYSPDGRTLASASGDGTLRLWDLHRPEAAPSSCAAMRMQSVRSPSAPMAELWPRPAATLPFASGICTGPRPLPSSCAAMRMQSVRSPSAPMVTLWPRAVRI